jgi:hypothetical protein
MTPPLLAALVALVFQTPQAPQPPQAPRPPTVTDAAVEITVRDSATTGHPAIIQFWIPAEQAFQRFNRKGASIGTRRA